MLATLNLDIFRGLTFGPVEITCKADDGTPFPLNGWTAAAQASRKPGGLASIDLAPTIESADTDGLIVLSEIAPASTLELAAGSYTWDLVLIDPDGRRLPPLLGGTVTVSNINTQTFPEHQTHIMY